jgi:hypothetical protein
MNQKFGGNPSELPPENTIQKINNNNESQNDWNMISLAPTPVIDFWGFLFFFFFVK